MLFLSVFPCFAQTDTYQFITVDASAILPNNGPLANYVPANQTLVTPTRLAVDAAGNVYFSDGGDIRRITTGGLVVPVAGYLGDGFLAFHCCGGGDGGPALLAGVAPNPIGGMGFDPSGNLWFSDGRPAIRRISPSGIIDTVEPFGGSLAVDPKGNVYVAARTLQRISPDGTVIQYPNTNVPNISNQLGFGIAADSSGVVYGANNNFHIVQKIRPDGVITTLAGNGTAGYAGDGGPAVDAEPDSPMGVAVDAAGNVYFADYNRGVVRRVSTSGTIFERSLRTGLFTPLPGTALSVSRETVDRLPGRSCPHRGRSPWTRTAISILRITQCTPFARLARPESSPHSPARPVNLGTPVMVDRQTVRC
jgi:sugar lactone lactonase YvrE